MTALIIEDDLDSQEVLRLLLLQHFPQIRLLGQYYTAGEGMAAIRAQSPQLVFLDIGLPDKTGFDLLEEIGQIAFDIVFVSGHDHYAAQAFRFFAIAEPNLGACSVGSVQIRYERETYSYRMPAPGCSQAPPR